MLMVPSVLTVAVPLVGWVVVVVSGSPSGSVAFRLMGVATIGCEPMLVRRWGFGC